MKPNEVDIAKRLKSLIQKHSDEAVINNSIQSIHRQGYITQILSNNIYTVMIDKQEYDIEAREGLNLIINDTVIIMLFNGDINRPWIIDKKPKTW